MTNRTAKTAAIILSLAAAGAPAASARPADYTPVGHQATVGNQAPASVYSRADKSVVPLASPSGGAIGNATAPHAVVQAQTPASVYSRADKSVISVSAENRGVTANSAAPQAPVGVETSASGFDWGEAGIGLAGVLVLTMGGVGGAVALSQRRSRRTTALPS